MKAHVILVAILSHGLKVRASTLKPLKLRTNTETFSTSGFARQGGQAKYKP
jgi:hypothetical protein